MLKYPAFNHSEWNFLSDDVSIAKKASLLEVSDKNIKLMTEAKQRAIVRLSVDGSVILNDIMDEATTCSSFDRDTSRRQDTLKSAIAKYREAKMAPYNTPGVRERCRRVIETILLHYSVFDSATFEADFAAVCDKESVVQDSAKKTLASINGKLGSEIRKRNELLDSVKDSCVGKVLPTDFRGRRIESGLSGDALRESERGLAESILRSFASVWRSRTELFTAPVSIYGVGIHTMPTRRRSRWMKAFNTLNLRDHVGKRPYYQWTYATGVPDIEDTAEPAFTTKKADVMGDESGE